MKKIILILMCFFLLIFTGQSQTFAERDSLLSTLKTLPEESKDTNRIILLFELAFQYYQNKPDTTYLLGQQAYELSKKINYLYGEARALNVMALGFNQLGDYAKSLILFKQSKDICLKLKDYQRLAITLNNMSNVYMLQGEWQKGLETLQETYAIYKTIDKPNKRFEPVILVNIGECFYNLNHLDSADFYLHLALPLTEKLYPDQLGLNLQLLGDVSLAKNDSSLSRSYYKQSVAASISLDSYTALNEIYYRMAVFYEKSTQQDSIVHFAKLALTYGQKASYLPGILKASQFLTKIYEGNNDTEALHYYKVAVAAKDSLFSQEKVKQLLSISFDEKQEALRLEAAKAKYKNTIRIYVLIGLLSVLGAFVLFLFRNNRQKQKANKILTIQKEEIQFQKDKVESTLHDLKSTQSQLIQSEKMASLGELTAGIAHEIQNPLNFVNNFSEVSKELIVEMNEELAVGNMQLAKEIAGDIEQNLEKINLHGKRAADIVKGMLQHSRTSSGQKEPTDINALAYEYFRLAYHGLRAKDKSFNATMKTDFDKTIGKINIIPQDIGRVILNLITNAFYVVDEKKKLLNGDFEPTVSVSSKMMNNQISISVKDNGNGISKHILDKIFQPFFTTKPTGQGTGLGLSLSYDIIKAHGGELKVETKEGVGSEFIIRLPL